MIIQEFLDPLSALDNNWDNQTDFTFSFASKLGVDKIVFIIHVRFCLFLSFAAP